jgi:hypothetical protein
MYFLCGLKSDGTENMFTIPFSTLTASPYNLSTSSTGAWNHIGWSVNTSGSWVISINGQSVSYATATTTASLRTMNSANPAYIGIEGTTYTTAIDVNIDEFRIFKSTLTFDQLKYLYDNPAG